MKFFKSISTCFSKYITFSGRASRSEFWWWTLFTFLMTGVFYIPLIYSANTNSEGYSFAPGFMGIILFLPSLAVLVRRLHDIGKGAQWLWLSIIPGVGPFILFIFCFIPSEPFENRFGYPEGKSFQP